MAANIDEGPYLVEQEPILWGAKQYHWDPLPPEQTTDKGQPPKQLRPEAGEKA